MPPFRACQLDRLVGAPRTASVRQRRRRGVENRLADLPQPVHLVGSDETPETTRANVFVDASPADVAALVGSRVRLGSATLLVTQQPSGCAGVYAEVADPGTVRVGDTVGPPSAPEAADTPEALERD